MVAVLLFTVTSCIANPSDKNSEPTGARLADTKWKLAGFGDVGEGELREPGYGDPWGRDPKTWYTLFFLPDTALDYRGYMIADVESVMNGGGFMYVADYESSTFTTVETMFTQMQERFNGQEYINALEEVQAFELRDTTLKLYYNDKKNYLLFRSWEE